MFIAYIASLLYEEERWFPSRGDTAFHFRVDVPTPVTRACAFR